MAWQFPQSATTTGITVDLGTADDAFVAKGVYLASTAGRVINGTGSGQKVIVEGIVANNGGFTINLGSDSAANSGNSVTIEAGGEVRQFGSNVPAVHLFSFASSVTNAGLISALELQGVGVLMFGSNATTTSTIVNSGTIEARDAAVVHLTNEKTTLTNSGLISGDFSYFSVDSIDLITNTGRMVGDIELGGGNDSYNGASGRLSGEVLAGDGNDTVTGGIDNDRFEGGNGNDTLRGNAGNDTLNGDAGDDVLTGGGGKDILTGGAGRDFFDFNSIKESVKGGNRDVITDFNRAVDDRIDLRDIDAKTGGGNQAFKFIGKQDFHDEKGELRYEDKGSKVIVQGDVNGDGKADFEIFVAVGALSKGDFIL